MKMSAEAGAFAILKYFLWTPLIAVFGYFLSKRDAKIDELEQQMKHSVSKTEAKEMIKEAVAPVRDELSRFQQQMTETALLVKQISDNLNKLHTEFTVNVRVQEALTKAKEESNHGY